MQLCEHPDPIQFKGNHLTNVYQRLQTAQANEIIRLWLQAGVVPAAEAARRCNEVVYTFHDSDGELIGVNTVYVAHFNEPNRPYYFYRTFIRHADRGIRGLPRLALRLTYDFLKQHRHAENPLGMVVVTENPKLMRRGVSHVLQQLGFHRAGQDARGCNLWHQDFNGSPLAVNSRHPSGST